MSLPTLPLNELEREMWNAAARGFSARIEGPPGAEVLYVDRKPVARARMGAAS